MENPKSIKLKVELDCSQIDTAIEKLEKLHEFLKEANTLTDELASKILTVTLHM